MVSKQWRERDCFEINEGHVVRIKTAFDSLQVLILEPSKILQPAVVCVSEEDEHRTVQLKHITPLKVCRPSATSRNLHIRLPFLEHLSFIQQGIISCAIAGRTNI